MPKRKIPLSLIAAFLSIAIDAAAFAHAYPDHSQPAVSSVLAQSPAEVQIWFTEKLEPAFSSLEVQDATGQRVDNGDAKVDASDAALLRVTLKKLAPGTYKVIWHVVSVDTHATQGDFTFTVTG